MKIWNVTDNTNPDVKPQTVAVLNVVLKPGESMDIPEEHLKFAHKVHAAVEAGILHIGDLPEDYSTMKNPPKASMPSGAARAHGQDAVSAPVKEVKPVDEPIASFEDKIDEKIEESKNSDIVVNVEKKGKKKKR